LPAPRRPLDLIVPAFAALTVFAFAAGSSSVARVLSVGHDARWIMLALLLAAAAARAATTRPLTFPVWPAAAAVAFVALAAVSSAWSVSPRLSVERAGSLALLFSAAILLAASEREPRLLVAGLVAGAGAVAAAGLVVLAVDHSAAVQAASYESPARFRGFGQDPNTAALLFGIALGPAVALAIGARSRARALGWGAVAALVAGSIVASGSRGGLFAGGAGALAVVFLVSRGARRFAVGAAVVVAAVVVGLFIQNIPKAHATATAAAAPAAARGPAPARGYLNAEAAYPLDADVGGPLPGGGQPTLTRGFFGGSGRLDAWTGTLHQVLQRPAVGFGFGTESKVFVDRYYYFVGGSPENSYLGVALQLGFVGLVALLALFATVAWPIRRARLNNVAAACAGCLVAGLVLAVVQSYVYSVGNIASATLWICAFLLPVVGRA
jgi:O-antigen ligase